jgi:hypothetical protein
MRTTLTLDDDVAALLQRFQRERKVSLKEAVNSALRAGLVEVTKAPEPQPPFRTAPLDLGRCWLPHLDNLGEVLAIAEVEDFK